VSFTWNLMFMSLCRRAKVLSRLRKVYKKNEAAETKRRSIAATKTGIALRARTLRKDIIANLRELVAREIHPGDQRPCNEGASKSRTNRSLWHESDYPFTLCVHKRKLQRAGL